MRAGLAVGVAAALLLLTWLLLRGFAVDARPFETALQLLDEIELAEASVRRDLLSARAGLLRDYDPLVRALRQVEGALAHLRDLAAPEQVAALEAWHARQEERIEAIKSANALLQNSLAHFGRLTVRLAAPPDGSVPLAGAGQLGSAMLNLTLDTSAPAAEEVRRVLADVQRQAAGRSELDPAAALLAHGWLLHDLLPRVDALLRELLADSGAALRQAIATDIVDRREAAEATARRYRLLLYASAVLLLGGLLLVGVRLRVRSLAMRRHAAFQHMLARLSTRLIGTSPAEVEAGLGHALEEIARRLGAQRAYLVMAGDPPYARLWAADGAALPDGWAQAVLAAAGDQPVSPTGILRFGPGHSGRRGVSGGTHAWFAAVRRTEGGVAALLGCDLTRHGRVPSAQELGSLGLALDSLLNLVTRSALESERARLAAREAQSRQMQMLGTFASGIAHNVNNIIGAILGFAEMAHADPTRARIADIRRAAERARDLASDILSFGGPQQEPSVELEIGAFLAETGEQLRALLPPGLRLTIAPLAERVLVRGDATRLQQVVVNLCRNASQAMDGQGDVAIEVEARTLRTTLPLHLGELRPDHYVVLRVRDTGPGMDAATLGRIFEPFFTTRQAGHGLGLATVGEIVLAHGGGIGVQSAPEQGSLFEVWLPRATAAEAALQELPRGEGEVVLLVHDDDGLPREEELLAALGYEPLGVRHPATALGELSAAPSRFDAVLLLEGSAKLAPAMRRAAPGLPIVVAGAPQGAEFDVIGWPLRPDELAATLHRRLALPALGMALQR